MNDNKNIAAQPLDLDKLEALARAATPGEWKWDGRKQDEDGYVYIPECSYLVGGIALVYQHEGYQADCDFMAAANPAVILTLIAQARASQPEGALICHPTCFWGDCPPCVEAGLAPSSFPASQPEDVAPSDEQIDGIARKYAGMGGVEDYRSFARDVLTAFQGATGTTGASVKTWQERLRLCPEEHEIREAMCDEIADLRAQLAQHERGYNIAVEQCRDLAYAKLAANGQGEPVAWIRFCSDGCYEGPIMHSAMEEVRKKSGAWSPLYLATPASAQPDRGAAQGAVDACAEMRALCSNCGGTGEVHRADGEYLGACDCMFQTIASPASQPVVPEAAQADDLAWHKEALAATRGKLAAVWDDIRKTVQQYSGQPCEGEPFDRLDELLSRLSTSAHAQQEAAPAGPPDNEALETLWEDHVGHPADFGAAVLERWGGWQAGLLGYGGALNRKLAAPTTVPDHSEREAANEGGQKPEAYLIPHLLSFEGRRASCPPELAPQIDGTVAWDVALYHDGESVIDKHGVEHKPIPLYQSPATIAAGQEATQECQYPHESAECKGCGWTNSAAGQEAANAKDAARWRKVLMHVGGCYCEGVRFTLRGLPPIKDANIMKGSVAQHFTEAIDAAMAAVGAAGQEGGDK